MADRRGRGRGTSVAVLLALLVLCVGGGLLIGRLFGDQTELYAALDLPSWAPPGWVFGPVWTALYVLMAVSAWLVQASSRRFRRRALWAFAVQLLLNFLWTPVFFGALEPRAGLAVIIGVLLAVGWWTFEAWRVRPLAAVLQIPYLLWTGYATALNAAIITAS